jgi:hypothetical protein
LLKTNDSKAVKKFGFPTTTCCGQLAIDNRWNDDWVVSSFIPSTDPVNILCQFLLGVLLQSKAKASNRNGHKKSK